MSDVLSSATGLTAVAAGTADDVGEDPAVNPFARLFARLKLGSRLRLLRWFIRRVRTALVAGALLITTVTGIDVAPASAAAITADGVSCTLGDAITAANTDSPAGGCPAGSGDDLIAIPAGTIALAGPLPLVTSNIAFHGMAASATNIDAGGLTRPFFIGDPGSAPTVSFADLTIANGLAQGTEGAGGGAGLGGAIFVYDGNVTLTNTTLDNNTARGGDGDDDWPQPVRGGGMTIPTDPSADGADGADGAGGGPLGDGGDGGFGGNGGNGGNPGYYGISAGDGGNGGFGGGGGFGGFGCDVAGKGGNGGFGGGGGGGGEYPCYGGGGGGGGGLGGGGGTTRTYGGAGSTAGFGGGGGAPNNYVGYGEGGGGGGLGGGVFVRTGSMVLDGNVTFINNLATHGAGGGPLAEPGSGIGGAVFHCKPSQDIVCQGSVKKTACAVVNFVNNTASTSHPDTYRPIQTNTDPCAELCDGKVITIDMNTNGGDGDGSGAVDVILGTPGNDLIRGFEGDDTICAGDGDDDVRSGPGADTIFGGEGADRIAGGGGADVIDGGGGGDTIRGQGGTDTILGGFGVDEIDGQGAADTIDGGAGADILSGQNGADTIMGGNGTDDIKGQTGPDTLHGDGQDDTLTGGNGNDTLYGGAGFDKCSGNLGPSDQAEAATCEQTPGVETLF